MSRLDDVVATLAQGGIVLLFDEDRPAAAHLVAAAALARPTTWDRFSHLARRDIAVVVPAGNAIGDAAGESVALGRGLPLREAAARGVLGRAGFEEAAVEAVILAGAGAGAVVATAASPGGVLADDDAVPGFAAENGLAFCSVQDLVARRMMREAVVEEAAAARLPTAFADRPLEARAFRNAIDGGEHLALVSTPLGDDPLVRLHSECLTGDALGSLRCDCGDQLRRALRLIGDDAGGGAVVYLRGHEGRGIGLVNKIRAYALQDLGRDTVQANTELGFAPDLRDYGVAAQILRALGIRRLRLLSNNPRKSAALERYGIEVTTRVPLRVGPNPHNASYLETKRLKLGHDLASRPALVIGEGKSST